MSRKWFQNWFNSPYYHILYNQRNDEEAEFFIDNLFAHLNPTSDSLLLDVGCGRGRHSVYLNKKGYDVTGIDLSLPNINYAKQFESRQLHFFVHDMRYLFYINYFDIALNLFTSFGYFETQKEHVTALKTMRKSLKKDGLLVLDYFNCQKIIRNLSPQEVKSIDGIDFYITKKRVADKIVKTISFEHRNKDYTFKEEVKVFCLPEFQRLLDVSGFAITDHFGDYSLNEYDENKSDRLILICHKKYD
ncbi:methyltransferase domain-containing protein [Pedobacter sp. HMF7647]|uniref:Methyltransferase domain-containing protein n=1 Tax=Hufsiella arboris TaxID=2695275 RepID=A0A7K1YD40_9SPHI|nr:methyltransferase domain-containing protein [Hufsiella arboris]MXV52506.1 methyltransferase domain-containing protein [Hufsiella arboris]